MRKGTHISCLRLFRQIKLILNLNKTKYSANAKNPNNPKQCRRYWKVSHKIFHQNTNNTSDNQNKIEQVPGSCEVVMPESNYFDGGL